ncbi:hypothetical protein [Lysobacter yangpyeongensis]
MSYRHAWACCALTLLAACQPAPAEGIARTDTTPPASQAPAVAPADPAASNPRNGNDLVSQLAGLTRTGLNVDDPGVASYLKSNFSDACSKDDALPFDQICQHYAEDSDANDPSPWPDLMLGILGQRIVSAVVLDPAQELGADWTCSAVSGLENVRACSPTNIDAAQRTQWLQRWSAFLHAAD